MAFFIDFMVENRQKLSEQMLEHIGLTFFSLFLAILISLPLGIYISKKVRLAPITLGIAGVLQTIPSIALLGFMLPLLGIGVKPAIFALFLYALLPILRNTYTGIAEVEDSVIEAARGMGMTSFQILRKVELPLALPVIFAGIRTATVINVGVATLAAYIGAGGLGEFIFGGIALNNTYMILAGAIPAALLAIVFDQLLAWLQRLQARKLVRYATLLAFLIPLFSFSLIVPTVLTNSLSGGFPPEFMGREDGYNNISNKYDLTFNTTILNNALMYKAVKEGLVDVISGYSTDGRIKAFNLKILEDDKHAFPPYYAVPIVRPGLMDEYPEVIDALNQVTGKFNDSIMTELNYKVDFEKQSPEEVAKSFLTSLDLWKPDKATGGKKIIMGSKIFTEQYILMELFSQLINGHTDLDVDMRPGLGGTKICFEALKNEEIDLYPEYTGTGFLLLLSPPQQLVDEIISDKDKVYDYVKKEFKEQFDITWLPPLGFNNTYALMTREVQAKKEGWERISDLK